MNQIILEDKIIVLSTITVVKLFEYDNGADLVALYLFYHKQCKLQKTNQSFTVKDFAKKGLRWGDHRFKKAKRILKKLDLIEDIVDRDDKGIIKGWYIRLKYIESHNKANLSSGAEIHPLGPSTSGGQQTNAGSIKNKMLKVINDNVPVDVSLNTQALEEDLTNSIDSVTVPNKVPADKEDSFNITDIEESSSAAADFASDIYDYYVEQFPKKKNKRKVAIERIKQALKSKNKEEILKIINIYKDYKKDSIRLGEWQYVKTAENFFGYERGTKIKFIENFVGEEEKEKIVIEQNLEETDWYNDTSFTL